MNWEAAGAIAEILGVIAVIGSLIYVGRQINQNTQIARANIVHETAILSNQIFQLIAQDSELADIYGRGTTGVSLNGVDLQRFTALVTMYMTWLEDIDSQATAGLYFDPPRWRKRDRVFVARIFMFFFNAGSSSLVARQRQGRLPPRLHKKNRSSY